MRFVIGTFFQILSSNVAKDEATEKKERKNETPWKTTAIHFRELISAVTNVKNYRLQCRRVWGTCNRATSIWRRIVFRTVGDIGVFYVIAVSKHTIWKRIWNGRCDSVFVLRLPRALSLRRSSLVVFNFSLKTFHTEQAIYIFVRSTRLNTSIFFLLHM